MMNIKQLITGLMAAAVLSLATSVEAVPAFARKYETKCSSCHTAWPQLNRAGRKFKEAGFRFPKTKGETTISDFLHLGDHFPVSAVIVSRPYDKKDSGDHKIRAVHEAEVMVAGVFYKNVSGFFELEAEDEEDFNVEIATAWAVYNHSKAFNAQVAYGPIATADPYDTFYVRRLTRNRPGTVDQKFGSADNGGKLRSNRQIVSVYGRPMDRLFYNVGVSGVAGDSEGVDGNTIFGRVAFDITPDIMIGGFAMSGECMAASADDCDVDRDYSRRGFDAQAEWNNFRFMGAWLTAEDDDNVTATTESDNDAWYLQGQYMFKENGRPTFVPMIRYDTFEKSNGTEEFNELTLNVSYYFTQNIKGYLEYWDQLDVPVGETEDSRITLQFALGF